MQQYCSFEEAWGEPADLRQRSKRPKKPRQDPACHLYERRTDPVMDDVMNMYEQYSPSEFSRTQQAPPDTNPTPPRSPSLVTLTPDQVVYDTPLARTAGASASSTASASASADPVVLQRAMLLEFLMFLASGLVLVFILEQFIQIGLHLRGGSFA